jgi:hypothetical protein
MDWLDLPPDALHPQPRPGTGSWSLPFTVPLEVEGLTRMIHECLLRPAQVASGGVLAPTLILNNS